MKKIRRRYIFYGRVQGVGFRYIARYGAVALGLTGWVRNEYDGTVTMEAQGAAESMDKLVEDLKNTRFIRIDGVEVKNLAVDEEERGFRVRGY